MGRFIEMSGQRFGSWTVPRLGERNASTQQH